MAGLWWQVVEPDAEQHGPDNLGMTATRRDPFVSQPAPTRQAWALFAGALCLSLACGPAAQAATAEASPHAQAPRVAKAAADGKPDKLGKPGKLAKPAGKPVGKAASKSSAKTKPAAAAPTGPLWGTPAVLRAYAADVAQRHGLPPAWVLQQLSQARRVQAVRELIMPPPAGTAKNWAAYRARFIEPERIAAGVAFWKSAEPWLAQAQARWGVPPEVVVGIVGVETFYGRVMGHFRVLDALTTLALDFPSGRRDRSAFFKDELEQLLLLSRRENMAPHRFQGSFAGAMGLPQFMPSSINRWAIDFDNNGHVDLNQSTADVVGSVAHYLASFGWQRDLPTHFEASAPAPGPDRDALLAPDIVPSFSAAQLLQRGALLADAARAHTGPLALVELQNGDAPATHVAGTQNFYVVTRYNWSSYYAMAVLELGAAVAQQRAAGR